MKMIGRITVLLAVMVRLGSPSIAQSLQQFATLSEANGARLISTSGVLEDAKGQSFTGILGVTFSFYKEHDGGVPLFHETQNVEFNREGKYSVLLGATVGGLPVELFATNEARWLGVQVQLPGEAEAPRVLLASVPYALRAADAETLGGKPLSAFVLADIVSATGNKSPKSVARSSDGTKAPEATSGTPGQLAQFGPDGTLVDSIVTQSGSNIGIGTTSPARPLTVIGGSPQVIWGRSSASSQLGSDQGGNIELGAVGTAVNPGLGSSPYIDFHFGNGTAQDYNARIINSDDNRIEIRTAVGGTGLTVNRGNVGIGTPGDAGPKLDVQTSTNSAAVNAANMGTGFNYGVRGLTNGSSGYAIYGTATAATGTNVGVWGTSAGNGGVGVVGWETATSGATYGGHFESDSSAGTGILGYSSPATGNTYGVVGQSNSASGTGTYGIAASPVGTTHGVLGEATSSSGIGVMGLASFSSSSNPAGGVGVWGESRAQGKAVYGVVRDQPGGGGGGYGGYFEVNEQYGGIGVYGASGGGAHSAFGYGGYFVSYTPFAGWGVFGQGVSGGGNFQGGNYGVQATGSTGVSGTSSVGTGVFGHASAATGVVYGVYGQAESPDGYGLYSAGNAKVTGSLSVSGNLNVSGLKNFKIDHPLDPSNKYLVHAAIESSVAMNLYTGNIMLDQDGQGWVELPDWFEALNCDFHYQLTAIGGPGPGLYIAEKVHDNRFKIAGGDSGMEVSWQLTGTRHDPYALANPLEVQEIKPPSEHGLYLHPELYGQPKESGLEYLHRSNAGLTPVVTHD